MMMGSKSNYVTSTAVVQHFQHSANLSLGGYTLCPTNESAAPNAIIELLGASSRSTVCFVLWTGFVLATRRVHRRECVKARKAAK